MPKLCLLTALCVAMLGVSALPAHAAEETHLHIHVVNDLGKPVGNAEVVVRFLESRLFIMKKKVEWELRTTSEGTVSTPGLPQGKILIQVSGQYYQTFGQVYEIYEPEKTVEIQLKPPQPQYSSDQPPAKK